MPDTTRTFIAAVVPDALAPRLRRLQRELAVEVPDAHWADTPPFHLTLAFLGDVPHADLNALCLAVAEAAAASAPLELTLTGPGAFPDPARPRVLWAGVGGPGLETLGQLQAAVAAAAKRSGYPADSQPFHPHVTLARMRTGRGRGRRGGPASAPDLTAVLQRWRGWKAGPFRVGEVVVFSSDLTPEGPVHAVLARGPLRGRAVDGASGTRV